ncbi:MAG TPA: diguanylate cyclase, partial [Rhodocyclaceae bacterium]|nr:diguanylate cyclase [Rhodocyclaceae bacterium]
MIFPSIDHLDNLSNRLQAGFIRLAKDEALWQGDLHGALRHVVSFVAETLDVGRAGVWLMRDQSTRLECMMQFLAAEGRFDSGLSLDAGKYPAYFRALDAGRVVDASDAVNDHRTAEFANGYLMPLGIGAMLDATLHKAGRLSGVLCLEHLGSPRLWSRDEQNFAMSMADLISQLLVFHELKDSERCYRMLFESAADAITMLKAGHLVDCNQKALELFNCLREEFRTLRAAQLSPPFQPDGQPSREKAVALLRATAQGQPQFFEWRYRRPDGSEFDAEVSLNSIWLAGEQYTLAVVRDVTERNMAQRTQQQAAMHLEQRNNALQVVNGLASCLHGTTDLRLIAEETVRVLHGLRRSELITFFRLLPDGKRLQRLAALGIGAQELGMQEHDSIPYEGSLAGLALTEKKIMISSDLVHDERIDERVKKNLMGRGIGALVSMPLIYRDQALGSIGLLFHNPGIDFNDLELETLQAVCQAVSLALANARHVQVLEHQAMHDSLTGLPNRAQLHRETAKTIEQATNNAKGISLMLLDLNRFKEVNDTLGHHTGDQLLKQTAERLSAVLQKQDALLARLGGDEFAVLARNVQPEQSMTMAHGLLAALRRPFEVQGIFIELGGSIGVAHYPQHGETSNALLRCSDVAMYVAKTT